MSVPYARQDIINHNFHECIFTVNKYTENYIKGMIYYNPETGQGFILSNETEARGTKININRLIKTKKEVEKLKEKYQCSWKISDPTDSRIAKLREIYHLEILPTKITIEESTIKTTQINNSIEEI